jgi:acyl-CoA dehydrogenase
LPSPPAAYYAGPMRRDVFTPEHDLFRAQVRRFAEREIEPRVAQWNRDHITDRDTWRRMGTEGFLGPAMPEAYGGGGGDFLYDAIVMEELAWRRAHGLMTAVHSSICMPYLLSFGTEEQKRRWLPPAIRGETLIGICMTEPGTGSDLANIQTRAVRDGDHWVLNGSKTFISLGQLADLFIVVARTDPAADPPHAGISLLLVEADAPGFVRGRKLEKLGLPAQDTSEIFFQDCRVPAGNLLGRQGQGFKMLMEKLQQERICIAVSAVASCRRALADTIDYVKQRHAFGQPIAAFQNTQFTLAELATEVEIGQAFVDRLLVAHARGDDVVMEASMAKWWTTDLQKRLTGECLQLHGGYGFMLEYPIALDYADAAVQTIYAGTNEIMKVIIARRLGLG